MRTLYVLASTIVLALTPVPAQAQIARDAAEEQGLDEADLAASEYFRSVAKDGNEHLLAVCGTTVYDFSLNATKTGTLHNPLVLFTALSTCTEALVIFHNHPYGFTAEGESYIPLPSEVDFRASACLSYEIGKVDPTISVSFRIFLYRDKKNPMILEYGLQGEVLNVTIANSILWRKYDKELRSAPKDSQAEKDLSFLVSDIEFRQYDRVMPRVMDESKKYIQEQCSDALFEIEGSRVCPSRDYFIRIRGTVPN